MFKYSFNNDYSEMAHPNVLAALSSTGTKQFASYGCDEHSFAAAQKIRELIKMPSADVHFVSSGTQSNLTVISSILRPHEAVIAPVSGHICVHETGAIEATGHKICACESSDGKLTAQDIESVVFEHCDEHMVKPRLVYISQSTEAGTVYTKSELTEISRCCRRNNLYVFVDGARLGAAVNSSACDMSYSDIAELVDVFYIGGTKNGALFGEAIVICNDKLKEDFRHLLKQRGALLAKGFTVGIQFETLFEDGLYDRLASHSNRMARRFADGISALGYDFLHPIETNIVIPVFPADIAEKLQESYNFYVWRRFPDKAAVRLVTSWATPEDMVEEFIKDLSLS